MKKRWFVLIAVAVLLSSGYALLYRDNQAPSIHYTSLSGQSATTDSLKGKVVLVNFWATSCSGCIAEMPDLKKLHQEFAGKNFETIAVAMNYDPPNYVQNFADKEQLPFFVSLDPQGNIAKAFGDVQLTPTAFLIDKQGKIIKRYVGVMDFKEVRQLIQQQL
ncbi:TlpA family protein disulfide reductase [Neisseriaceae bacterium TC5R-5]|nr:TlpA family protein disulfide reductase [Neisseriaceae bacterium TC5R-5]